MVQATLQHTQVIEVFILPIIRLRAVSSFSLQSYCTRNLNTRAASPVCLVSKPLFTSASSEALMHQSIALRAVTIYRPETQTNKIKLIFSEFLTFL